MIMAPKKHKRIRAERHQLATQLRDYTCRANSRLELDEPEDGVGAEDPVIQVAPVDNPDAQNN